MPSVLLLEPHNDDVALFAAYSALREGGSGGHIVTCLRSCVQESYEYPISFKHREEESYRAAEVLGCTWKQWGTRDDLPPDVIDAKLRPRIIDLVANTAWERVYAPLPLLGGHDHHNIVGMLAQSYVPSERLTLYATYVRGEARHRTETEVEVPYGWAALKYRAMACYFTQINEPRCQPWFATEDCLREWVA